MKRELYDWNPATGPSLRRLNDALTTASTNVAEWEESLATLDDGGSLCLVRGLMATEHRQFVERNLAQSRQSVIDLTAQIEAAS
jgi:hypothetical protein